MREILNPDPAATRCDACPLRKLAAFRAFTVEELAFVQSLKSGERTAAPGTTVLLEGHGSPDLYTVLSGWAFRYKSLPDGRRQIVNFAMPGDFLGLQATVFQEMDHSVEALSDLILCVFPRSKMWSIFEGHPGLAFDLTWIAAREERLLDEQLLSIGRRSAIERIAYVLVHLYNRARVLNLASSTHGMQLPVTQQHLADALGLSLVHTNKTLRRLTDNGLIVWKNERFKILEEESLRRIAKYENGDPAKRPLI